MSEASVPVPDAEFKELIAKVKQAEGGELPLMREVTR